MTDQDSLPPFGGPRPNYEKPPVVEVVLSVQFEPLAGLTTSHLGLVWDLYRAKFSEPEEQPPLGRVIEEFNGPETHRPTIQIQALPTTPRCWFKTVDGSQLIQLQKDRFIFNWRRFNWEQPYPRYEWVRQQFVQRFQQFADFLRENELGPITPNQCEITYVNHAFVGEAINSTSSLEEILAPWTGMHSDTFLGVAEHIRLQTRYRMLDTQGRPQGRLHISAEPRLRSEDQAQLMQITLVARGAPHSNSLDGVLSFFDFGREYVVRGFTSFTSRRAHKFWERTDV